jgi:hypothetical protein
MEYFRFFVLKDGAKLKNNKLKGDTNIILGGQKCHFGRKKLFFFVYLRIFFKILEGQIQDVGPPLHVKDPDHL